MCLILAEDKVEENWPFIKEEIIKRWSELTYDDLIEINGSKEFLIIHIQEKCGKKINEVEKEVNDFERDLV